MEAPALVQTDRRATRVRETLGPREPGVRNGTIALAAASLVSVCLLVTGAEAPLPALGWAAAFLFIAVERDVREGRIPNWLTVPAFGLCVAHGAWSGGLAGALASLWGAGVVLALLVLPYAVGWFGAGDVKALMVLGALWGAGVIVAVLAWAIVAGGALALAWVALHGGLADLIRRWSKTLSASLASRSWAYFAPPPGSAAAGGIPFGVAVALGVAAQQQFGPPWV
jgi:prepilin peptidase CpaA